MKIQHIFAVLLMLFTSSLRAEISFSELAELTATDEELSGEFVQEKYLAQFETSIQSSGTFSYQRGKQIIWQTLQPIQSELVMTPTQIVSRQGDVELLRLDAGHNAAVAVLSNLFFSVLTSEWDQLDEHFTLSGNSSNGSWQISLTPKEEMIANVVNNVELSGERDLERVVMHENNGDRIHIAFRVFRH